MRRFALFSLLTLLILPWLQTPATAKPAPVTGPAATSTAAKATAWKCGKWKHGKTVSARPCVRFTKTTPIFGSKDHYFGRMKGRGKATVTCTVSKAKQWQFSTSASVEAEAGVVFAKAKTAVSAGLSRTTTTTTSMAITRTYRNKRWFYCAFGTVGFKFAGQVQTQYCTSRGCYNRNRRDFTAKIPSSPFIEMGPGRAIDWRQMLPSA